MRYRFVDLFKGFAVVVMVEVHIVNALLVAAARHGTAFAWLNYVNGLVAPAFLFTSGYLTGAMLERRIKRYRGAYFFHRLRRVGGVFLLGYALHLYTPSLRVLLASKPEWLLGLYSADILQNIAIAIMALSVVSAIWQSVRATLIAAWVFTFGALLLAPFTHNLPFSLPAPIAPYFTSQVPTLFPLLPFSAFLVAGALAGYAFGKAQALNAVGRHMTNAALLGGALFLLLFMAEPIARELYASLGLSRYWLSSPTWYGAKMGLVLLFTALWYRLDKPLGRLAEPVALLGRQSLFAYAFHLVIVYSSINHWGLAYSVGPVLSPPATVGAYAGMLALTYAASWGWEQLKTRWPKGYSRGLAVAWAIAVVYFVVR